MRLHFLGANRQVTGSRYLLEVAGLRVMIDCGLFQERRFLGRNWESPPVPPASIDYLLLTHGHLDHCGLIPRLVGAGLSCPIIATEPTVELAELIMMDSARIQEEDAAYKKRRHQKQGRQPEHRPVPLYDAQDVNKTLTLMQAVGYAVEVDLGPDVKVTFHEAGHILGSAMLEVSVKASEGQRRLIFSGDVGQWDKPLIRNPSLLKHGDFVVMESTYGDQLHKEAGGVADQLANVVNETVRRGGNVVIPTFAVERVQELTYHLGRLVHDNRIPDIQIFLDSPMAIDVTEIFRRHRGYLDRRSHELFASGEPPLCYRGLRMVRTSEQSKAISQARGTNVIMSTSGMCTAGRIKHHPRQNIGRAESTIVFVGYQAEGTLGRQILNGDRKVRIHGRMHEVKARIAQIHGISAHGDCDDLLRWLASFDPVPRQVFLTHGEKKAAESLAKVIVARRGLAAQVPAYQEVVELEK